MTSSMPMGNLLSFISPYLESMLLARRLKISLQQHLPDSEHQNHEMRDWPAPGSEDTELGVLMELEVGHGETEVYAGVQA